MKKETEVGLVIDPRFEEHDTGPGHPERPERLQHLRRALDASDLPGRCRRLELEPVDDPMLLRVHGAGHLDRVREACASGELLIDSMDTAICFSFMGSSISPVVNGLLLFVRHRPSTGMAVPANGPY